jgi:hypothetical protein
MVSWTELKSSRKDDPFKDPPEGADRARWVFERDTSRAAHIRGQLTSHATAYMSSRFRLHSITLLILGAYARFIRWDRSAAIVSERFNYVEQPTLLVDYLWRLSHASDEALGIDPTVVEASVEEADLYRHHVLHSKSRDGLFYKVTVPSREVPGESKDYIIPFTKCRSESPFGRGTRSTIALRLCDTAVIFLKDYWRVRADGALNEGETYRRLEEAKVPHIAAFDHGNDLDGHETVGHLYQQKSWACKMGELLDYKQHYRMTLTTLGRDLALFNSSREYTQAIADAMEGQQPCSLEVDGFSQLSSAHRSIFRCTYSSS